MEENIFDGPKFGRTKFRDEKCASKSRQPSAWSSLAHATFWRVFQISSFLSTITVFILFFLHFSDFLARFANFVIFINCILVFVFKKTPYTLTRFDLTTHSSSLLDGRRRRYHSVDHAARAFLR
jgi:hypothetical protein